MSSYLNQNERSWAIDVIAEINLICSQRNLSIKKAGGEHTLSMQGGGSLFPDVLLFGDSNGSVAIQGWELKMPDTAITDMELVDNAIKKAKRLNLRSFLLWNVKEAVIYTLNEKTDSFNPKKNWTIQNIQTRTDVQLHTQEWKHLLKEIIDEIDQLLSKNYIKPVGIETVVRSDLYQDILTRFVSIQSDEIKQCAIKDSEFEIVIDEWYEQNKSEFDSLDKYFALAQINIITWINRFLFAHYLKTFNPKAVLVESIDPSFSVVDAIEVFEQITNSCDFMNVFKPTVGIDVVDDRLWSALLSFNQLLSDFAIESIGKSSLHKVIDNALGYSRKKMAGQFSTPHELARFLVEITIKDRTKHIIDTCCGTGTIAKSAYQLKRDKGITIEESIKTVWASDKFAFPLQLCSIALSDPQGMGQVVQVFQKDVISLGVNEKIEFTDPYTGQRVERILPEFHAVISNLPFVRFEDVKKVNPNVIQVSEALKKDGIVLSKKSDLYAYISLTLDRLVEVNGRIGLITSNSWLGVDWGDAFRSALLNRFNVLRIVISANGKWFKNAEVVSTLIILEKLEKKDTATKSIDFVTTKIPIEGWDESTIKSMVAATIGSSKKEFITKQTYTRLEISEIESLGLGWTALFVDSKWVLKLKNKLVSASSYFDINRGERRGWDDMFYPENGHGIEKEYIKPVLKSTRNLDTGLVATPSGEAFCCSDSIEEIEIKQNNGALKWINKFSKTANGKGKPLPDVLKRSSSYWYEMKPDTLADIVVSMNPDKKLSFYRLKSKAFVNQRLIRFTSKNTINLDVAHALLNSAIGMFLLESAGFGRGLGALDINAGKLSRSLKMLDLQLINEASAMKILSAFDSLINRPPLGLEEEIKLEDRRKFDEVVVEELELDVTIDEIYSSLLELFNIRQTVRS